MPNATIEIYHNNEELLDIKTVSSYNIKSNINLDVEVNNTNILGIRSNLRINTRKVVKIKNQLRMIIYNFTNDHLCWTTRRCIRYKKIKNKMIHHNTLFAVLRNKY